MTDWATEYSELASRKAEQIAQLEEIQRKALAAAEAETLDHYRARKKAEEALADARRYLTDALDIIATRVGPVGVEWYEAAKRAAGEEG